EIDITSGEPLPGHTWLRALASDDAGRLLRAQREGPGHRQPDHFQAAATSVARIVQALPGIERDFVLRVPLVVSPGQANFSGTREAREVVDVPVRLVIEHTLTEPDDAGNPQIIAQIRFQTLTTAQRVAIDVEQTLFRDQRGALTIDVNRASLVDDRRPIAIPAFDLQHLARHELVLIPGEIHATLQATPCVEMPIDTAHRAVPIDDERRPDVAHPTVVMRHF